jgi:hypothetical protein
MKAHLILATLALLGPLFGHVSPTLYASTPLGWSPERPQVLVGPTIAINRNYHTGGFPSIKEPICPVFRNGTGWGYAVGLSAEFAPTINSTWGIIPRMTFELRPGQFREDLPDIGVISPNPDDPDNPTVVNQTVFVESDITYALLNFEVLFRQQFAQFGNVRLSLLGGPAGQYVVEASNRQMEQLEEPANARFRNPDGLREEDFGRRLILYEGNIPQRHSVRFSTKFGLQGEIPLFGYDWVLTPGFYFDYGITDVTPTENWQLNSAMFQLDFRRAF